LENINGVYYVDMEELKEVLRLTASYNPIAGIVTLSFSIANPSTLDSDWSIGIV